MVTLATLNSEALSYLGDTSAPETAATAKTTAVTNAPTVNAAKGDVPTFNSGKEQYKEEFKTNEHDAKADAANMYTTDKKAIDLDWQSNAADNIMNAYIMSRVDPNWNKDQAKNTPGGNLNRLNYNDTLDLSRQADVMNNKRWWRGEDIGARTNSGFGSSGIGIGRSTKYEPITTEEMRQMQANRDMSKYARNRQIGRAETAKDYKQRLQENADRLRFDLASKIGMSEVDLMRSMQNAVFNTKYVEPNRNYMSAITQNIIQRLALENKNEVLQLAVSLYKDNPVWADNYISNMLAGNMPSLKDSIESRAYAKILAAAGNDPIKAVEYMNSLQAVFATSLTNLYAGMFRQMMPGAQ